MAKKQNESVLSMQRLSVHYSVERYVEEIVRVEYSICKRNTS